MANMLSDTTGRRITGLREREDMTLDELAAKIGINATTLGRIEKGQTQKINSDVLVALAREFSVSTDFLLGLTSIPERKNYDISELGLSAQSVRNLYTQRVDTDVVNRLLEHPRFATLTAMIAQYLNDTFAAGAAVQNQIFASMSELLVGAGQREVAQAVNLSKVPPHQVELTKIQTVFMNMLKEMKHDVGSDLGTAKNVTKEVVERMMDELSKGQEAPLTSITPDQVTDAILHTVGDEIDREKLAEFRRGLVSLFENLPKANDTSGQ